MLPVVRRNERLRKTNPAARRARRPKWNVACWPIASFRGGAAIQSLSVYSGHGRTCCWLDPVANDPERTSPTARETRGFGGYDDLPRPDRLLSIVRTDRTQSGLLAQNVGAARSAIFSFADVFLQRFGGITSKPYGQQHSFNAKKYRVANFCCVSDRFFRPVRQRTVR
jgi:hypothetical protein